jgi:hypothetical protein
LAEEEEFLTADSAEEAIYELFTETNEAKEAGGKGSKRIAPTNHHSKRN